ncbi:MAG: endonuclease III [Rhodomicrobium sp.]|nr:endonuclease III [Rhodomicrobium sp.]
MEKPVRAATAKQKSVKAKAKASAAGNAGKTKTASPHLTAAEVHEIYARLAAAMPSPKTELEHVNPFTLLVAVVLSAQATDVGVNKATRGLFAKADSPEKMLALGEEKVREAIKSLGFFNAKTKSVVGISKALVERHGGKVPQDRAALEALPGVGRKSANVVLNVAFGQPTIAVDTHIFRVANRTGLAPGKTPLDVELGLERVTPPEYIHNAHHWLILHGRYVCKARKPECWRCLIADLCKFEPKTPAPGGQKAKSTSTETEASFS